MKIANACIKKWIHIVDCLASTAYSEPILFELGVAFVIIYV